MSKFIKQLKEHSNFWMFGAFIFVLYGATKPAQQPAGVIDHFKVGDVVYSVLDEAKFTSLHGTGWYMMDGRSIPVDADLRKSFGFTATPDGRGVFIRAIDPGRGGGTGDPAGQRAVGAYQADAFKRHSHGLGLLIGWGNWSYGGNNWAAQISSSPMQVSTEGTADETRPRNIALYVYIKIKEQ